MERNKKHQIMTEAGKNIMNQFNPNIGSTTQEKIVSRKKLFEPSRLSIESQKYHFVVDWQIDDEEEDNDEPMEKNPYNWY